ncbi:MAG: BMP family ABC transporter substrate-binding protein [Actinomycetota bacterium]
MTLTSGHRSRSGILRLLALLLALGLVAAACGDSDDATDAATADEEAPDEAVAEEAGDEEAADGDFSDVSVFMILDGSADDGGWNTTHLRGLTAIEEAFPGIQTDFVESVAPGQTATNAFEDAAASGADVVIGTTFYQDDMMDVAAANPDTIFVTWAGFETADNVGHFDGASEEGRYLDGIVAGSLSESGIVGYPVGFPFNEVNRSVNAFTLGAQTVNPDIEVQVVYLNTWFDPAVEQQAAEALVNAGADVLAHEVGAQVYATVAAANDGYVIGYTNDWSDFEPEAWASSFLFDWGVYYVEQIQAVIDGTWEPELSYGGLAAGYITAAPYGPDVTPEILELVEEARQGIIDGTLDPFAGPISDNEGNVVIAEGETIPFEERINCCQWLVEGVNGSIPG